MTSYTINFNQISKAEIAIVGGKGANLGELTNAGFKVPPGFCITTRAYSCFMAEASTDIYSWLEGVSASDLQKLRETGHRIREYLATLSLPEEVAEAIIEMWHEHGEEYSYAVRSSATAEDLPYASFAGQQDTYLNISGRVYLLNKVKDCFISLFTDRAILYRIQNGFDHHKVALSVIVQQMVQSEVSGILFTADPLSGNRNTISIDASFGLGEALVSGLVSADLYQVDKRTNAIIKKTIAEKTLAIRSLKSGGVEQINLDTAAKTRVALTDEQIVKLAGLGHAIEEHYGVPQDIEWARAGGEFYITQSRPITSLYPLPEPPPSDEGLSVYVSLSHAQVMTDAMPPLSISVLCTLIPLGRKEGEIETTSIQSAGGRLFADLSKILRHPLGRRIVMKVFPIADQLIAKALEEVVKSEGFLSHGRSFNPVRLLPKILPNMQKMLAMLLWGKPEGITEKTSEYIKEYVLEVKKKIQAQENISLQLKTGIDALHQLPKPVMSWAPYFVLGGIAGHLIALLMRNRGNKDDVTAIGRGMSGNVTTEMSLAVGDLADLARASESIRECLCNTKIAAVNRIDKVRRMEDGEAFSRAWQAFLEDYGARSPSEIDLSLPRWAEDPSSVLQMVVNSLVGSETGAHQKHFNKLVKEGEEASQQLVEAAREGLFGIPRSLLIRRLLRLTRNLTQLREHHKFFGVQIMALLKPILLNAGKELTSRGLIKKQKDIWFLRLPEIISALQSNTADLKTLIEKRRIAFTHYQTLTPPRVMTSDGEIPVVKLDGGSAPQDALLGSPVSAGVVEGVVRVVTDPSIQALNPGEILVAPFTDPGWTPLFVNAGGLITEVGGLMTHGSVVAREYGIPAVVGVIEATSHLKNRQVVRVNGDEGYVEILDDPNEESRESR